MTLVSVVIPTYNRSGCIQRALESVLEQTHSDLEIVVVDDKSNDDTIKMVEEYSRKDARVRLLAHTEQKGAQAARNTGIRAAKGEWIAFLDSDDHYLPDSLEVRLRWAEKTGTQVVHSNLHASNSSSFKLAARGLANLKGHIYKELLRSPGPMFQALLVSKKSLERIGLLDETIVSFQEWDTSIRLARRYEFSFVPAATFVYDCGHPDSISKDAMRTARGYEQVFKKNRWPVLRYLGPKALAFHYQTAAGLHWRANKQAQAVGCLFMAFLLWPFRGNAIARTVRRCFQWTI